MLKVIELFAGIGAPRMALKKCNVHHETIGISEIEKLQYEAYQLIHGETPNFGDITKIEELPPCDFIHASSPCQSFSASGKRDGLEGKSGVIVEFYRLMDNYYERGIMPTFVSFENVPELKTQWVSVYNDLVDRLEKWGYNVYNCLLNAADFGNATKRIRLFIIGIQKDKDHGTFSTPVPTGKSSIIEDHIEKNAPESLYVDHPVIFHPRKTPWQPGLQTGWIAPPDSKRKRDGQSNRVYDRNSIAGPLSCKCQMTYIEDNGRYRQLSNQELWTIQGFSLEDYEKIKDKYSRARMGMFIGNSIALGPLCALYENLKQEIELLEKEL